MVALLALCICLIDGAPPYTVDQPPPVPTLSPDNDILVSKDDGGFNVFLGTLLSFGSDTSFPRFVGPSSNPWLAKDPRSLTEGRILGVLNWSPTDQAQEGKLAQQYLVQARIALNKRWQVFLDKAGYDLIDSPDAGRRDGWSNLAVGGKYVVIRDVEHQFLLSIGAQYEGPTGEASVYQRPSDGSVTGFLSVGQEFWCFWHLLGNVGVRAPLSSEGSTLFYSQLHIDRECWGWLYPLVEVNYYRMLSDGRGVYPNNFGQGDAFIDWSAQGTVGSDLVTVAVGIKAKCTRNTELGITYERPLTDTPRVLEHRVIAEFILRY